MKSWNIISTSLLAALLPFAAAAPTAVDATDASNLEYEYIVVGSGAGGGPLATIKLET
jgi:choline dehydrogenase